jgi:hypothetical protein
MRLPHRIVLTGATLALAIAPAALAGASSAHSTAEKQCRQERTSMGKTSFDQTYGTNSNRSNAFGKCVSHRNSQNTSDQNQAQSNAAKQCKAQQSDPNFSTTTGNGKTFDQFYGTNKNGANAYGKCVSTLAKAKTSQTESTQVKAEDNAARQCRTERTADPTAFKDKYGTNHNKSNAFGKCVSTTARSQEQGNS